MDVQDHNRRFQDLPWELHLEILTHLGVASACHYFINCPMSKLKVALAKDLDTCAIEVTPEEVIDDDLDKIDFYTYDKLPECPIHATTTMGLWKMTMWHLENVNFKLLTLTVNHELDHSPIVNVKHLGGKLPMRSKILTRSKTK